MDEKSIGQKIYELRKKAGYSQEELGERIGVSRQSVSKWELSEAIPSASNIGALSNLFSVTTDYFLTTKEEDFAQEPNVKDNVSQVVAISEVADVPATNNKKKHRIAIIVSLGILAVIMATCTVIAGFVVFPIDHGSLEIVTVSHFTNSGIVIFIILALIVAVIIFFLIYNIIKVKKIDK